MENVIFNGIRAVRHSRWRKYRFTISQPPRTSLPTEYRQDYHYPQVLSHGWKRIFAEWRYLSPERHHQPHGLYRCSSNSYAIIELGMVDDPLNDKDHSRRMLLKKLQVSRKFKKRKKRDAQETEDTGCRPEQDLPFGRFNRSRSKRIMKSLAGQANWELLSD